MEASADAIERGALRRALSVILLREATDEEIRAAIAEMSRPFGAHADRMAGEQWAWRRALSRPGRDAAAVQAGLAAALEARGLSWDLRQYPAARAARAARAAWAAWDARAALTVTYASLAGWITHPADPLTRGIRDSYQAGLEIVLPVAEGVFGWAMAEEAAP